MNNLLKELIDVRGGDVRFEVGEVAIRNEEGRRPAVGYTDATGRHEIACDHVVGCDGSRGVSRSFIPDGVLTKYTHEYGYAWMAALVEAPVVGHPIMGVSDHGFVAQLPRGPSRSRYYLRARSATRPRIGPTRGSGTRSGCASGIMASRTPRCTTATSPSCGRCSTRRCSTAISSWPATSRTSCPRRVPRA